MRLPAVPFTVTDLAGVAGEPHAGERGTATWYTVEQQGLRVRIVEYTPGYVADHWCPRGHVLFVLDGEYIVQLKDGTEHTLRPGMSFQAGDDPGNPHASRSPAGARVFIVD